MRLHLGTRRVGLIAPWPAFPCAPKDTPWGKDAHIIPKLYGYRLYGIGIGNGFLGWMRKEQISYPYPTPARGLSGRPVFYDCYVENEAGTNDQKACLSGRQDLGHAD